MARLLLTKSDRCATTQVSNVFIEDYLPKAPPIFSAVYLLTYKRLVSGEPPADTKQLADLFGILESDVVNAWKYWDAAGLVRIGANGSNGDSMTLFFLDPPEKKTNVRARADNLDAEKKPDLPVESKTDYSLRELEYYQTQNEEIRDLFGFAEKEFGRTLKYADLNILYSLHDWLRFPIPVIKKLITYCGENGHRNINYIETVAIDWRDKGIESADMADEYIRVYKNEYKSILKAFGQQQRNPAAKEIEYMDKWLNLFAMPIDVILEACDKTIMATGKPVFKYADTILSGWHAAGVMTVEDAKRADTGPVRNKTGTKSKPTANKNNRFVNFESRQIDFDTIDRLENEFMYDLVQGPAREDDKESADTLYGNA